jgi:transcriptional regulator with XRE-family HTH domain
MGKLARRVDAYVGERIRERRTAMGLTQDHLAGALEISYQQVQKYETGANRVSAGRLYEVAKKLDVDVSYFFEGLDEQAEVQPLEHGGKNRSTIELVRNFSHIADPQIRSALSGLVKSLVPEHRRQEFGLEEETEEAPAQRMTGQPAPADQGDD